LSALNGNSRGTAGLLAGLLGCFVCSAAGASDWTVAADSSAVTMYAVKQGTTFNGVFQDFSAEIEFDPAHPESGRILGIVKTGSIETHDAQNDTYVHSYLETEEYPEARFESKSIETIPGGFRANGDLTVKGITRPAAFEFTFAAATESTTPASHARLAGGMTVNRFDFDVAADVDINFAGQDIYIQVELELRR
jgi:polyisoprenoid-binding protein YceI